MKSIPIRKIKVIKEPGLSENFSIRDIKDILNGKDLIQELHRHDHYFILALKNGKGEHTIDFTSYNIINYSVFFLRPGQVHHLILKAGSKGYLLQFNTDFFYQKDEISKRLLRNAGNKNFCPLNSNRSNKLFIILSAVLDEYSVKREGYREAIKAYMNIFFIELVRQRQNIVLPPNNNEIYSRQIIDDLYELLEINISKFKQVSRYAEMLNLTVYQLNSITKAALDKTCSELIIEHIILEAKRYLLATSSQINQIAFYLGYEDYSYFIRFFKKHTGYTPNHFREKFK